MKGIPASEGVAVGAALVYAPEQARSESAAAAASVDEELTRFVAALERARKGLADVQEQAARNVGAEEAAVFEAQAMMLEDPAFVGAVQTRVKAGMSAPAAVEASTDEIAATFAAMEDEYFRAREADVRDVGQRVLRALLGVSHASLADLDRPAIVVARDLTPSDTATLRRDMVLGFATEAGGLTSHTAIIARAMGIPAVVGVGGLLGRVSDGDVVLVDGGRGEVELTPSTERIDAARRGQSQSRAPVIVDRVRTRDGADIEVAANAGSLEDVQAAVEHGADAIGLLRTEFLYLDRPSLPEEEEQFEVYSRALEVLQGRPLVVRTLDAGGDKALPGLPPVHEPNPFLGLRGIRLCLRQPELLLPQLRAALRASVGGDLRLMFPMVAFVEELEQARTLVERCRRDLADAGVPTGQVQVGIMVETPAAALLADRLAETADFFSLGTNDLVQYTLAVDRTNERVGALYQSLHPAVLRAIQAVVRAAHARGRWVGVCGEMAGMPLAIPLLVGLGVDELSASPGYVPRTKALVQRLSRAEMRALADRALECSTALQVEALVGATAG